MDVNGIGPKLPAKGRISRPVVRNELLPLRIQLPKPNGCANVRIMQAAPLFLLIGALVVIYAAQHPMNVFYALLAVIGLRALR